MNNIHNNRVGYTSTKSFLSNLSKNVKGILPAFLFAFVLTSGLFLTSCSDPLTPVEEVAQVKVDEKVETELKPIYNVVTFGKAASKSNQVNLNNSVRFNGMAKYQLQIKDIKSDKWVNLDFEMEDNNTAYLRPKLKLEDNGIKMENRFISIKNTKVFLLLDNNSGLEFVNQYNQYQMRVVEMIYEHNLNTHTQEGKMIVNEGDIIEQVRYNNINECKNKIKENEIK